MLQDKASLCLLVHVPLYIGKLLALANLPRAAMPAELAVHHKDQQVLVADEILLAIVEIQHVQPGIILV